MADDMTTEEAATEIARRSPEAAGLLAACMQANADHTASLEETLREGLEGERDRWRERALAAERHLQVIDLRLSRLLMPPRPGELEGPP